MGSFALVDDAVHPRCALVLSCCFQYCLRRKVGRASFPFVFSVEKEKSYLWPASLRQLRCWKVSPGEHVVLGLVLGFGIRLTTQRKRRNRTSTSPHHAMTLDDAENIPKTKGCY